MALETSPWDAAKGLDTPEAVAAYIEAAFEDGDPGVIAHALGAVARAEGLSQVAEASGLSRETLVAALAPDGDPRLSTLLSVLGALGMKVTTRAA